MQNIGKVLKIIRIANNMSRKQASEATSVSAIYISELETGKKINVSKECLVKLAAGYGLRMEQIIKLEKYYTNSLFEEERKYRRALTKALIMIESNRGKISRRLAYSLIILADNVESANETIEQHLGPVSYKKKIEFITGMFDVPEIVDRQLEDTDEQVYYIYLTHIINNY